MIALLILAEAPRTSLEVALYGLSLSGLLSFPRVRVVPRVEDEEWEEWFEVAFALEERRGDMAGQKRKKLANRDARRVVEK